MATFQLVSILIHTTPGGDFVNNDVVNVLWNDSSEQIEVTKNGSSFTPSSGSQIGEINTNFYVSGITSYEGQYAISGYSFCDGDDLIWFRMLTSYAMPPFMQKRITVDSPVCGTAICDLHFIGPPTITHSTDLLSNNGQIIALAESSNGTVKYALDNFRYGDQGQTSGTISGLAPGIYTLYAKDANDCTAQIEFTILFQPEYKEHYRFTWASIQIQEGTSRDERIRIYEREYPGDLVEIDNGDVVPFTLYKPKQGELNNKFSPIHPTNAVLSLMSEVNYQFLALFTQDNKKYRAVYEVDEGAGFVEIWQGFGDPNVYQENFVAAPYATELRISDNVKLLEDTPFTDDNGQLLNGSLKLIKVIAHIMKKTGLELSIRSGINIFETNHNTAETDDPLDQTYIDVACYREGTEPFSCWEVLEDILKPFGARLVQSNNQWVIEEIDRAVAAYAYRVFDYNGDYLSNSTFDPIIDIKAAEETNRAALVDRDHSLEVVPSYGNISITSNLNYVGSIVRGSFEKNDLLSPESEVTTYFPGVFTSEEGFRDWSLRLNGAGGVSFGRSVILDDDNTLKFLHISDADRFAQTAGQSVGAFFFNASQWSGNVRDAYIESAAKPFEYGQNDEIRLSFDYSTPGGGGEYPFMVLRFALKVGDKFLQQDLSWSTTEYAYRVYPQISTSLQKFEFYIKLPDTGGGKVETTVQVRIYNFAKEFYDFGLPSPTSDPADGTGGETDLRAMATVDVNYDFRADVRAHVTISSPDSYVREFVELRISDEAESALKIIHPNDFDESTNPKIFFVINHVLENTKTVSPTGNSNNHRDRLFYIDNVGIDSFINGQEPARSETIDLRISKYVNETMEVELYNFDLPDITNAKNMYNNYFRLSDGTPTSTWARSGIAESSKLQEILLKVLGSNHSAPTFRLTGSFINEFSRISPDNYLRLTKPGSSLVATNTEFETDLTGWNHSGSGTSFSWTADNDGSAEVTLTGSVDSKKLYQTITHSGGYIQLTGDVAVVPAAGNDREDILWAVFFRNSSIVHAEKVHTFTAPTSNDAVTINHRAFAPGFITGIGFFIQNINGTGECTYQVGEFTPDGVDIEEIYQIADYTSYTRGNTYSLELMQISKTYISLSAIDSGGTNQSGGGTGGDFNHDYNSDFSGGIN